MDLTLDQLTVAPKAGSTPVVDPPLIDLGSTPEAHLAWGPHSRPLIDLLINTPDADRNTASKPLHEVGQVRHGRRAPGASAVCGLSYGFVPRLTYVTVTLERGH